VTGAGTGDVAPARAILLDAAVTAAIAFLLALPFVGFHLLSQARGLEIEVRLDDLLTATAAVFVGRVGLSLAIRRLAWPAAALGAAMAVLGSIGVLPSRFLAVVVCGAGVALLLRAAWGFAAKHGKLGDLPEMTRWRTGDAGRWLGPAFIALALLLPVAPFADRQVIDVAILVLTYVMLGWGLNIVVGLAGLLDLGYVAFYAVGAYSFALLAQDFGLGFWACLPLAGVFAAFFGILLGFPVLRLRGDYLAIVTLGFGEIIRIVLLNWVSLTNGPNGISSIPRPTLFGLQFAAGARDGGTTFHEFFGFDYSPTQRVLYLYYVILALALLTNFVTLRMRRLPIGRAWEALREDEIACRALGINPTNTKLTAFAIGAMFGGFAGSFFATRQGFISPESFKFLESAIILAIVVLGGMGSQIGVAIAAIVLIGLPEWFRELQEYRMLAFGAGMVLIMIWRPKGLLSHREPTLRLAAARP
jgi:branched-chain amino acid transport system permease protein